MMYKTCADCGANLDFGEMCDCVLSLPEAEPLFTRLALFAWAKANEKAYPALRELSEEKIKETVFLKLEAAWGRKRGLVVTFEETLAAALRRRSDYRRYAVALVKNYDEAQRWILECAKWSEKHAKTKQ